MKAVCRRKCYIRTDDGVQKLFYPGQVHEFKKCPAHFEKLEDVAVDFLMATEDELTETKWKFSDAFDAILEECGVELKKEEGTKKSDIIDQILDARYRQVD